MIIENRLHFLDRFEPGLEAFHPEVVIEERAVEALDDAVGLGTFDARGAVLVLLKLEEQR
jgi:hypothetical protein